METFAGAVLRGMGYGLAGPEIGVLAGGADGAAVGLLVGHPWVA
jgi:hypothetical protein